MSDLIPRHVLIDADEDSVVIEDGRRWGEHVLQAAILITSTIAIWLVSMPAPLTGWGHVVGLASQPLWWVATWRARQWGMFVNAMFWTGAWTAGIYNHFL